MFCYLNTEIHILVVHLNTMIKKLFILDTPL